MGYTHYFENVTLNEKIAQEATAIIEETDVKICGGLGEGHPEVSATSIWLNGSSDDGDDYETFSIENADWGFCKTAR